MNRIRKLRQEYGLTLKELTKILNSKGIKLNDGQLSKYERGEQRTRNEEFWKELSILFSVPIPYLMGLSDVATPEKEYGNKMRLLREKNKLSLDELSSKVDIDVDKLTRFEMFLEIPDNLSLQKLSTFYNVSVQYLVGFNKRVDSKDVKFEEYESQYKKRASIQSKISDDIAAVLLENYDNDGFSDEILNILLNTSYGLKVMDTLKANKTEVAYQFSKIGELINKVIDDSNDDSDFDERYLEIKQSVNITLDSIYLIAKNLN
jgi:transcriptional regulator with XRE-family HTH domain